MPRIDLNVPFAEKDEAKRLGARWDGERKVWYVPEGIDAAAFSKWTPKTPDINIRAASYFVAQTSKSCWKCGELTSVYGFMLPSGHETLEPIDEADAGFGQDDKYEESDFQAWLDSPASSMWVQSDEPTSVHYISDLPLSVAARIKGFSRHYRVDFSKTTQSSYWMNHCECCGMKQGDFEMYEEPQGAFFPTNEQEASGIVLHLFEEPFACNGNCSYGVDFFDYMRRS